MGFYQSIAEQYEQVFPLNIAQVHFVKESIENPGKSALLDVGCGTGSLSIELGKDFQKVIAIDLDGTMLKKAKAKAEVDDNLSFVKMSMLDIEKHFAPNSFDSVICFGNTIVHLKNSDQISNFFKQSKSVLKENGRFLFQIINYDRIIDQKIDGLPTIDNDKIQFVRDYKYDIEKHRILFETKLVLKKTGKEINNTIPLYPLRKRELEEMLKSAGFRNRQFYGNFKRDIHSMNSIPLIIEAN